MSQVIVFKLDNQQLAIKAENVIEIIRAVEVIAVPETNSAFVGIINYRGQVVHVVRVSTLFRLNSKLGAINEQMIIVSNNTLSQQLCLIVDHVTAFLDVEQLQPVLDLHNQERLVTELARIEASFVPILDVNILLTQSQKVAQSVIVPQTVQFNEN